MQINEKEMMLDYIRQAIREDVGDGDHTTLSTIPASARGKAVLVAKEAGVIAGMEVAEMVYREVDPQTVFTPLVKDGSEVKVGDKVFTVEGSSRSILIAERLSLNYIQRMSGIATHTRSLVRLMGNTKTVLLDTRKTTPNNRVFEKLAVKIGGGMNHRFGLFDMILIKDNHIDFAGGIPQAIDSVHAYLKEKGKDLKIEIEVRSFDELNQVLEHGGVNRIMLDNFSPEDIEKAVALIGGKYETEASGGITRQTLARYAATGVDFISVGALTHHIASLDLSLKAVQ
ncbi:MAG: carboxylating nicotinate-nucleotide diphosphorylase [Ruminococcus flavefaciens]|nr:carboxylating nicotinate-nucleotide diphosphorylase [Ruminococcus flavefaciens]